MPVLSDYIIAARAVIALSCVPDTVNDYPQLMEAVTLKEFADEVEKLENISLLEDDEAKKVQFAVLCRAREELNSGTWLHFATNPRSMCNELYFNIAQMFYPEASFHDLFMLLLPRVDAQWKTEVIISRTPSGKTTLRVALIEQQVFDTDNLMKDMPVAVDTFNRLVILGCCVFVLDEIANFDFELHRQLHEQLKNDCSPLLNAIASHNEELAALYGVIERLSGEGATVREVIEPIARRMMVSGTSSGSGELASEEGSRAAQRLITYHAGLPIAIKTILDQCKSAEDICFAKIMADITAETCIETASSQLLDILANPVYRSVFDTRPYLNSFEKDRIVSRYKRRVGATMEPLINLTGTLTTIILPIELTKFFYQQIVIDGVDTLVNYLIAFPAPEYAWLLGEAAVDVDICDCLGDVLALLNDTQHKTLVSVMMGAKDKLGLHKLITVFARVGENRALQELLDSAPPDERLDLVTGWDCEFIDGRSAVLWAVGNAETLLIILNSLSDNAERLAAVHEKDATGCSALYWAADNPKSLKMILDLFLDNNERLTALVERGRRSGSALHRAAKNAASLQIILNLCVDGAGFLAAIKKLDNHHRSVLHWAADNAESVHMILNLFPESERLAAINESDIEGRTVVHCAAETLASLQLILSSLPNDDERLTVLFEEDDDGISALHLAAKNSKLCQLILSQFSNDTARRLVVDTKDKAGHSFLHWAKEGDPESLQMLLKLFPPSPEEYHKPKIDGSFYLKCLASGVGMVLVVGLAELQSIPIGLGLSVPFGLVAGGLIFHGLFSKKTSVNVEGQPIVALTN